MRAMASSGRFAVFAVVALVGCGPGADPTGPASGRVTVGGKPLAAGSVYFQAVAGGTEARAALDADGRYEIKSYKGPGLPPGAYRVAILPGGVMAASDGTNPPAMAGAETKAAARGPAVPDKYRDPATSGLTAEVRIDGAAPLDFDLTP